MKLFRWVFGLIVALSPLAASAVPIAFSASLDSAQEVAQPPVVSPGIGTGTGTLTGGPGAWVFNYTVNYSGLLGTVAQPFAHIQNAPVGVNGPIVHNLDGASQSPIAGSRSGTIVGDWRFDDVAQPLTDVLAQALLGGNLYFNIHTTSFLPGEIRGQLFAVPEPGGTFLGFAALAGLALTRRMNVGGRLPRRAAR